ncbi:MAG: cysteine desulfurase family protein [Akkermansia sp.]
MIYWDNNATTPVTAEVFAAMEPFLKDAYANPSSNDAPARAVRRAIDEARQEVALLMGASAGEIIFTSGATESINTTLRGMVRMNQGKHLMCVATDHPAALLTVRELGCEGLCLPVECPVDGEGMIVKAAWDAALHDDLAGVSLTWANNETGVSQEMMTLVESAHEAGVPVHVDGVQALGKEAIDLHQLGVEYASFSAHKLHGPKGIGALFVRSGARLPAFLYGGAQEDLRRAGTENVPGIIGFGVAARLARENFAIHNQHMRQQTERFESALKAQLPGVRVLSEHAPRVVNTSNILFEGCTAQALMLLLASDGMVCSAGSACKTASPAPSHVLTAMGLSDTEARACVRFSRSMMTTNDEVEMAVQLVIAAVRKVRSVQSTHTGPVIIYR